jgi:hypothetical protein
MISHRAKSLRALFKQNHTMYCNCSLSPLIVAAPVPLCLLFFAFRSSLSSHCMFSRGYRFVGLCVIITLVLLRQTSSHAYQTTGTFGNKESGRSNDQNKEVIICKLVPWYSTCNAFSDIRVLANALNTRFVNSLTMYIIKSTCML